MTLVGALYGRTAMAGVGAHGRGRDGDERSRGAAAGCGEEGGAMGWLHGRGTWPYAARFLPVRLYVLICCLGEEERKEKREKRKKERDGKKQKERKNVESFLNLKIFKEKNKSQFMKLV
jgi:hypothetical protein